jgi:hypothetical protein
LSRLREAGIALFFLALATLYTWPLAGDLRGQTLWGVDPLIDLYTVHWVASHALAPAQIFAGNIFHPAPHGVLYSDLSLGTTVLVAPLRLLVGDPVPLYDAAVLLALGFTGWAFCALTRALTGQLWAGVLAGVLAAFGSHQMLHIAHLNLLSTGWIALLLLGLHRLLERPSWAAAALAGVAYALTALSTGYYAVAAALIAIVFAVWHARRFTRASLAASAGALSLALLLIAPYATAFASLRESDSMRRPIEASAEMAFQPGRDLTSHGLLYGRLLGKAGPGAQQLFPGLLTLVLAGVALLRRRPHAGFYLAASGALVLVALGPRGILYNWLFAIPPLDSMRHPYTFAGVAALLLAVLAGLGFAALPFAQRRWAGPLVVVLAVAETLPPAPRLAERAAGVPPAYAATEALPSGPVLEIPVLNYETLLWAARHGLPVLNGSGAFVPRATLKLKRAIEAEWLVPEPKDVDRSESTALLVTMGARYVIVPVGRWDAVRPLAAALDRSHMYSLAAVASDGDRIYEIRRPQGNPAFR